MLIGSLFSGIGAPEFAVKALNIPHTIEYACDIHSKAKETYVLNHVYNTFHDDISTLDYLPYVDLLVYGFPCQSFSLAGNRKGLLDVRGALVLKALDLIAKSRPKYFIAENVEGLLKMDGGKTLEKLLKIMRGMGYTVKYQLLNSLNFNIPQSRNRLWIVGVLGSDNSFRFPTGNNDCPRLETFLERSPQENVYATSDFLAKEKVITKLSRYNKPHINCITKTICRNGSSSEYISYVAAVNRAIGEKRKPTVSECAKLFGLPDTFKFPSTFKPTQCYDLLANSMVVPVVSAIISNLI